MLSHPLDVFALVSRYLTNKLISHRPLLQRRTFDPKMLSGITRSFPRLFPTEGYVPMPYYPVCRSSILPKENLSRDLHA